MQTKKEKLAAAAQALMTSSEQARGWVRRVAPSSTRLSAEERALVDSTRRAENQARKIAASATRRNCAGLFGPSQAGKSYLVSALGRTGSGELTADFAGRYFSFKHEINPEGGKESTGLVTRFTIEPGTRDAEHPVELRLLTETDLVKILGNGFLSDFDPSNRKLDLPRVEEIRAVLERLEGEPAKPAGHLDEIALFDVCEYFETNFRNPVERLRQSGYWEALIRLAPRLATAARIELYSLLWGRAPALTRLFTLLFEALETVGHAPGARSVIETLIPRTDSIINVEVLKQGLDAQDRKTDVISVVPVRHDGTDGRSVKLQRATLAALVAEVRISMPEQPCPFFQHTDLLDFPGARSRQKLLDLPADGLEAASCVRELFVRGKVAYLFQRYTEERELASMLLCMPPEPQEVKDMTALVREWVTQTHGVDPAARRALSCSLFFVLTKFDLTLEGKSGDTPDSWVNRIDTRLKASMHDLYGNEEWLQNWDGAPFGNTYFTRDPGRPNASVFEYAADPDSPDREFEVGIAAKAQPRIEAIRRGLLDDPGCRRHFRDPAKAWSAAVAANEGGMRYLVEQLESVLSPDLKTRQLAGRLADQARMLDRDLRQHYTAGAEASRKDKEDALLKLRRKLFMASKEEQFPYRRFAWLLARLKAVTGDLRGAYLDVASLRVDPPQSLGADAVEAEDTWADDPWADGPAETTLVKSPPPRQRDRYDHFANQAIGLWAERARSLAKDERALAALRIDQGTVLDLADELVIGAHRLQLASRIADEVRSQLDSATTRHDEVADRAAGIAAFLINDFVSTLGFVGMPSGQRPRQPKQAHKGVFEPPPIPKRDAMLELGPVRSALDEEYFLGWGEALRQFGLDNLETAGGREISDEENSRLGAVLVSMQPALQLAAS